MKTTVRKILDLLGPLLDLAICIPTFFFCLWMKLVRKLGISRLPLVRRVFRATGIFPIKDHYYEPLFNTKRLKHSLRDDLTLPGIQWNLNAQKQMMQSFCYQKEILNIQTQQGSPLKYSFENDTFRAGDSEYLYNLIRHLKPRKMIEIGSGNSTLMAITAVRQNQQEDANYKVDHICIEPFERPWLEKLDIKLIRKLVEDVDLSVFQSLEKNDILFIDSSHIIRPQGDVLFEYLQILPSLKPGVFIHVHDIFSPKDYLSAWIEKDMKLWNEQYLLEAFLSNNHDFEIVGALNFLKYKSSQELSECCPVFGKNPKEFEPGSFWIKKIH